MRAIVMHRTGGPEVLELEEVPVPEPGPGQVLVRTEAIGAGYYETPLRAGVFPMPVPLPAVFGFEAAGTVTQAGEGVDTALEGTRVLLMSLAGGGSHAEYVAVAASDLTPIPDGVSSVDAVAVAVQGAVALCLLRTARLTGRENVLIEVAAGGVGGYLTQLAREHGAGRVIGTAGGPAKVEHARELGAETVLDHTEPEWPGRVREALGGGDLDVVFESIGGDTAGRLLDALAPGTGRVLLYGVLSGPPAIAPMDLLRRGLTLVGCGGLSVWAKQVQAARADALRLAAAGRVRPLVDSVLPLADVANAHRRIESRVTMGKIVLLP